ncbi:hypothetical protein EUGRSUZ_G00149 [Eucalyptus grandis]|uniref:Uncharacterized protein n=2 Tax=Eucalyptus grandis TaxID=71139 RepID=A0ACC3K0W1_EUCGR|nr:hypothetical protein EUGRSUZ_G00149 [Eucalyptus grandis]
MAREMEVANWNLDEAIPFIKPQARFAKPGHQHFAIESFEARSIFEGFNFPDGGRARFWRRRWRGGADGATACWAQRRDGLSDERWVVVVRWPRDGGE